MSVHMDETMYEKPFEFNPWRWEVSVCVIDYILVNEERGNE